MNTLDYYNANAEAYAKSTITADVSELYRHFEPLLPPGATILDLGCGSGRDSKHFIDAGFHVTAVDGSAELCKAAERYLSIPVKNILFQDLDYHSEFDGVWACASLLHVPRRYIQQIIKQVNDAIKPGGHFYASFKYGTGERESNGRYFSDYSERDLLWLSELSHELLLHEWWLSGDVRDDRHGEKWLNVIWQRRY